MYTFTTKTKRNHIKKKMNMAAYTISVFYDKIKC